MSAEEPIEKQLGDTLIELEIVRLALGTMLKEVSDVHITVEEIARSRNVRVPIMKENDGVMELSIMTKQYLPRNKVTGVEIDDFQKNQIFELMLVRAKEFIQQFKLMKEANPSLGLINGTEVVSEGVLLGQRAPRPDTINYIPQ